MIPIKGNKIRRNRSGRCFTLLELIIILMIIVSISSIVGIKVQKSIVKYSFERSCRAIKGKIYLVKQLAFVNQQDLYLNFKQEENILKCEIEIDGKLIQQKSFKNVYFSFTKKNKPNEKLVKLCFTPNGQISPGGIFTLFIRDRSKNDQIDLRELSHQYAQKSDNF